MRDIGSQTLLTDGAEDLAADILFAALSIAQNALGGGHHRDSQPVQGVGQLFHAHVDTEPGSADPFDLGDDVLAQGPVFQIDAKQILLGVILFYIDV